MAKSRDVSGVARTTRRDDLIEAVAKDLFVKGCELIGSYEADHLAREALDRAEAFVREADARRGAVNNRKTVTA